MLFTSDELLHELESFNATLARVARCAGRAGHAGSTAFDDQLDMHARHLRAMLDADSAAVAQDAIDAARRVLDAADPAAPLLMLEMARRHLAAVMRHRAARAAPHAA